MLSDSRGGCTELRVRLQISLISHGAPAFFFKRRAANSGSAQRVFL